ncbi:hypothetical protein GCM10011352_33690 [Marinobacterium zhoushanense]|uniref:CXXCH cytochrome family protein n=1 Tax=Marinobacterium zhoushanense TaxID=1679163 RepID=A0ABQ1KRG1_9GAMM|nr:tetratricopeptide repeat protein [Marinobacterium zhoushanense]GGC04790.1 hypothetical protein GCM10011352_33690 [Marinobacterium zhoushanense]
MRALLPTLLLLIAALAPSPASADSCAACHPQESARWQQSQHAVAMQIANENSVLGDFSGHYADNGIKAEFQHANGRFGLRLTEQGEAQQWNVRYTFGVYPLQQYLIDMGDGRLQALNIAWDSRPEAKGGQRWFRLDEPEQQIPGSPLHWRGVYQNWNSMCADCHTTALVKGYSADRDRYDTRYDRLGVGCSACHSQAEAHAEAAKSGQSLSAGLDLKARGAWLTGSELHPPRHIGEPSSTDQIQVCGRCHALRTRLSPNLGGQLGDEYSLNRLFAPLYYPDGRVREEVFVLGSFLQSPMYQAGVVCSNCHDPHSGKTRLEGNALCSQCHAAASFDRVEHHRHPLGSEGARCVSCHMPQTTYMQVDARREHNFTTPDPLTAAQAGSPDPCLACHQDRDRNWSAKQVSQLWPNHRERSDWFSVQRAALPVMKAFLENNERAPLLRASLLEMQAPQLAHEAPALVAAQLDSESTLLRESAWRAALDLPADSLAQFADKGLSDPTLAVRLAAFETLLQRRALPEESNEVRQEYERYLNEIADRPAGRTLKARYALLSGQSEQAERDLNLALEMDQGYLPARLVLSDLLREQKRFSQAESVLSDGLATQPGEAMLLHLRGLTRLQLRHIEPALEDLKAALQAAPDNSTYGYRLVLAMHHTGHRDEAAALLLQLTQRFPDDPQIRALQSQLQPKPVTAD